MNGWSKVLSQVQDINYQNCPIPGLFLVSRSSPRSVQTAAFCLMIGGTLCVRLPLLYCGRNMTDGKVPSLPFTDTKEEIYLVESGNMAAFLFEKERRNLMCKGTSSVVAEILSSVRCPPHINQKFIYLVESGEIVDFVGSIYP